jgi:hypothetical protein
VCGALECLRENPTTTIFFCFTLRLLIFGKTALINNTVTATLHCNDCAMFQLVLVELFQNYKRGDLVDEPNHCGFFDTHDLASNYIPKARRKWYIDRQDGDVKQEQLILKMSDDHVESMVQSCAEYSPEAIEFFILDVGDVSSDVGDVSSDVGDVSSDVGDVSSDVGDVSSHVV